jgi:ketosteroid isomerase-like protein
MNESQISTLIEQWANAVRAQDMDGVLANHTADVVMFDVPAPLQSRGIEEYKKTWELFFDHSPGSFDVTELHIVAGELVAYCHAIVKIFDSQVRLTVGLRKEKEQWMITHEHHSYPIELTSGK